MGEAERGVSSRLGVAGWRMETDNHTADSVTHFTMNDRDVVRWQGLGQSRDGQRMVSLLEKRVASGA